MLWAIDAHLIYTYLVSVPCMDLLPRMWPTLRSQGIKARFFHASVPREGRQIKRKIPLPREAVGWDLEKDFPEFENDDIPATGHMYLHQQRRVGYYLRLIENETRQLVGMFCE